VDLDADHEQSQYKLYNLPYIPVNAPGTEPPPPIQTQLNSGEPTNYYQQGSADVPWYNRPTYPNIPVNAPGTEPPPPIQTQLNSGEPTNYYQQGSADVAWYNRPTYPNIPVNAPGTEPPPPIQTKLNSGEPTNYYQQGSADVPWYNRPTYPNIPVNAPGTEPPPPVQTKLTIGEPGDKYEQEADIVASQVVQQINSPVPVQSAQGQTVQREDAPPEEEEQVQAKSISDTIQREEVAPFEEEQVQAKLTSSEPEEELQIAANHPEQQQQPSQKKASPEPGGRENNTGLPDNLKSGIENLSGYSMNEVKVHYNSDKPAQLQALAYTQGAEIHVAPGQEKHLPHEAWHVVQQAQGRVQPTMQMKTGVTVNDDQSLEHEADLMGAKALINTTTNNKESNSQVEVSSFNAPIQMVRPASKAEALTIAGTNTSNKKGKKLPAGMRFRGEHSGLELKQQLTSAEKIVPEDLTFEECDVNTKIADQNRDAERLILGSDGRVWYTDNHYKSFVELTE
jgi:guanyl-specific ribonuclease Sa